MRFLLALTLVVPGVARLSGWSDTYFRTSLALTNPSETVTTVHVRFGAQTETVDLPPRAMKTYGDVLTDLFHVAQDTSGAIYVDADVTKPVVTARTYNDTLAGTFGESIAAQPVAPTDAWIYGLTRDSTSRMNIGSTGRAHVMVGNREIHMQSAGQLNRVDEALALPALFAARVTSDEVVYASRVENGSGDASLMLPQQAHSEQFVAPAGAFGTDAGAQHSSLVLTNPGDAEATVTIEHFAGNTNAANSATIVLAPRTSQRFDDFATERFGAPANLGYLRIISSTPVIASARAFTGAIGHNIPVAGPPQQLGARSIIAGLAENTRFRTRVSFLNTSAEQVSVKVTIVTPSGEIRGSLAVKTFGISPRQSYSFPLFADEMGFPNMGEYYLIVEPTRPNSAYVWATLIDRMSGDPGVVLPVPVD